MRQLVAVFFDTVSKHESVVLRTMNDHIRRPESKETTNIPRSELTHFQFAEAVVLYFKVKCTGFVTSIGGAIRTVKNRRNAFARSFEVISSYCKCQNSSSSMKTKTKGKSLATHWTIPLIDQSHRQLAPLSACMSIMPNHGLPRLIRHRLTRFNDD